MDIQCSDDDQQLVKSPNTSHRESAVRLNLALLQPGGFVRGLAGAKYRFRNLAACEETAMEFFAEKTKDTVKINPYVSGAKLALR